MKTVIDAVNEFKANYEKGFDDLEDHERCVITAKKNHREDGENWQNGVMYFGVISFSEGIFELVCTKEEFIQCVEEMSKAEWIKPVIEDKISCCVCHVGAFPMQQYCGSCGHELLSENNEPVKPVYTKEMEDNNEWLTVGMMFNHKGKEVKALAVSKEDGGSVLFQTDGNGIDCCWHNDAWVNPIKPPIDLIDGKAYQFTHMNGGIFLGFYRESRNSFFCEKVSGNKICGKIEASNIQLLEVKA